MEAEAAALAVAAPEEAEGAVDRAAAGEEVEAGGEDGEEDAATAAVPACSSAS